MSLGRGACHLIRLMPGGLYVGRKPVVVETILGSCVSVCLFAPNLGIGAVNHAVLPENPDVVQWDKVGHYMESSLLFLLSRLQAYGVPFPELLAKIVGGAQVLAMRQDLPAILNIGLCNTKNALEILAQRGIPVVTQTTGGVQGRKIRFFPRTGELYVRELSAAARIPWNKAS